MVRPCGKDSLCGAASSLSARSCIHTDRLNDRRALIKNHPSTALYRGAAPLQMSQSMRAVRRRRRGATVG